MPFREKVGGIPLTEMDDFQCLRDAQARDQAHAESHAERPALRAGVGALCELMHLSASYADLDDSLKAVLESTLCADPTHRWPLAELEAALARRPQQPPLGYRSLGSGASVPPVTRSLAGKGPLPISPPQPASHQTTPGALMSGAGDSPPEAMMSGAGVERRAPRLVRRWGGAF